MLLGAPWSRILLLEDDAATSSRRMLASVGGGMSKNVTVRLHEIRDGSPRLLAERAYKAGSLRKRSLGGKAAVALRLLDESSAATKKGTVVVAGASYGSNKHFLAGLRDRGFAFVTEVRASELFEQNRKALGGARRTIKVAAHLGAAKWRHLELSSPVSDIAAEFTAAKINGVTPHLGVQGQLFAARTGGIEGVHRGTILGFSSSGTHDLKALVEAVAWARWIRPALRRRLREDMAVVKIPPKKAVAAKQARVLVRANIALADRQDERADAADGFEPNLRGVLGGQARPLDMLELFAGAGGMGLGFLLAGGRRGGYRLAFSGEVNPIYVATLRRNHAALKERCRIAGLVPDAVESTDLRSDEARRRVARAARALGGIDVLIGGPPCQGFSNANRNSWSSRNPNNRLVDVFMTYVEALRPLVFVMENVQGILWTPKGGRTNSSLSVVDHLGRRMERAGYFVFPKLLDAVWYGVPQYRSRFFLVGLHRDLGYSDQDFGAWGPFPKPTHGPGTPRPYVTVREAIRDLPRLGNGDGTDEVEYFEPDASAFDGNPFLAFVRARAAAGVIHDHVTSRHADYVIERYRRIPPGGNWEDIMDTMTNYANVERTHSNIYRRLTWGQPSITIGHYRKSMLVHPSQHRGLSLREASRLQSFPDWFRLAGAADGSAGGLVHKQQQLANAVCPLVTRALASFFLRL